MNPLSASGDESGISWGDRAVMPPQDDATASRMAALLPEGPYRATGFVSFRGEEVLHDEWPFSGQSAGCSPSASFGRHSPTRKPSPKMTNGGWGSVSARGTTRRDSSLTGLAARMSSLVWRHFLGPQATPFFHRPWSMVVRSPRFQGKDVQAPPPLEIRAPPPRACGGAGEAALGGEGGCK